jgi:hypothetical protein
MSWELAVSPTLLPVVRAVRK